MSSNNKETSEPMQPEMDGKHNCKEFVFLERTNTMTLRDCAAEVLWNEHLATIRQVLGENLRQGNHIHKIELVEGLQDRLCFCISYKKSSLVTRRGTVPTDDTNQEAMKVCPAPERPAATRKKTRNAETTTPPPSFPALFDPLHLATRYSDVQEAEEKNIEKKNRDTFWNEMVPTTFSEIQKK